MIDLIERHEVMYTVFVGVAEVVTVLPEPAAANRGTDEVGENGS